jgi:hypothetical protein
MVADYVEIQKARKGCRSADTIVHEDLQSPSGSPVPFSIVLVLRNDAPAPAVVRNEDTLTLRSRI